MSVENNMQTYLSPEFFQEDSHEFVETTFSTATTAAVSAEDIFNILEALEGVSPDQLINPLAVQLQSRHDDDESVSFFGSILEAAAGGDHNEQQEESTSYATTLTTLTTTRLVNQKSTSSTIAAVDLEESENEQELDKEAGGVKTCAKKIKKQKLSTKGAAAVTAEEGEGQQKISHIAVERNRRKQMNDNLAVLRSLMPSFYVKRGDQASIVGGVVDYITELQQVLQSLEAKKQRKLICNEVLSPRQQQTQQLISSPRLSNSLPISPRKPPLSPRLLAPSLSSVPSSPTTPQPRSPYKNHYQTNNLLHYPLPYLSPTSILNTLLEPSPSSSSCSTSNSIDQANELVAHSKSAVADVEVKFSGPHVLLKTISHRVPGQAVKIISALEDLSLEILNVSLKIIDELTMLNSFTIKIGIECQLSAEELSHLIQQTFC